MTDIIYGPTCRDCGCSLEEVKHYPVFNKEHICINCLLGGTNDLIYNFLKDKGALDEEDIWELEEE